ncbi:MAG: D-alanyl-D-alanine carboxypeptidase/D-alanyl-D-alanine-endopeptidase [Gammaproteobacteria bacterium]|nr:D-alanyl-D-alanine carboxypeptidase/D-alanyl-D-alanine-endopeptidase [Gammaproteobacteria bacterium]
MKLIVICLLLHSTLSFAAKTHLNTLSIKAGLNRIATQIERSKNHPAVAGIIVKSLRTGKILYQHNANHLFAPASTQKTITSAAALLLLGPEFRFKTEVFTTGQVTKGILNGDLSIQFGGDPELSTDELKLIIQQLSKVGIKKITGHVYIDNHDFDSVAYAPGWIWDDLSYSYGAPVNAIIINHNKFSLHFVPKRIARPPKLIVDLPAGVAKIKNDLRTVSRLPGDCPITIYSDAHNHYRVGGCLLKRWGEQHRSLAIRSMSNYAKVLIRRILQDNNIQFSKPIKLHRVPKNSDAIAIYYSPPLSAVIKEMLKDSDNLTTNAVFKKIGETYSKKPGNWQNGLRAVKSILSKRAGLNFKNDLLAGGAGMSRYNLLKPSLLLHLLSYVYQHPKIRKPFVNALPIAGIDGTLKGRMIPAAKGQRIKAKTGTMTGVSSLAGYIRSKHNGTLAFVIMFNNFTGSARRYKYYENKICLFLMQAKRV